MKITVLVPSRGRPHHLLKAVTLAHSKASGKHEVKYVVGCDADDPATGGAAYALTIKVPRVEVFCTQRPSSLGELVNRMAESHPADAYCGIGDDTEVQTPCWDDAIYNAWAARPDGVWWWRTLQVRPATYPIVSEKWRAAAGRLLTDLFPFWWDDVWLMQVWHMASGGPALPIEAILDDKAFATHRMRDLRFWSDFYTFLKPERQRIAKHMATTLGWPVLDVNDTICDVRDEFLRQADKIEKGQGDKGPPTPEYLRAKARAEAIMKANAETLPAPQVKSGIAKRKAGEGD